MPHTVESKDRANRVILVTILSPFNMRTEVDQVMEKLENLLGAITNTIYVIYDLRQASISFSDIVAGVSTGFARPYGDFNKQLMEHGRMILVGTGTLVTLGAKTASRFSPEKPFPVFLTSEEAIEYAQTELTKQQR